MYRLFIAVDLPEAVRAKMKSVCAGVTGAKWATDTQMHLTLRFIGAADDALFGRIKKALTYVQVPAFDLEMSSTGCFPGVRNARILWAGIRHNETIILLKKAVDEALSLEGLEPEDRPFSPHITLARIKTINRAEISRFLSCNENFTCPTFTVTEFHLYSSTLSKTGATYTKEQSYLLGQTTAD